MTHEERVALAEEITRRIAAREGENVLAVAIYGSVAKGEDGPDSDLELWVATREAVRPAEVVFVYRGLSVEISYETGAQMLAGVREVGSAWAIQADPQRSYRLLFEREGFGGQLAAAVAEPLPELSVPGGVAGGDVLAQRGGG